MIVAAVYTECTMLCSTRLSFWCPLMWNTHFTWHWILFGVLFNVMIWWIILKVSSFEYESSSTRNSSFYIRWQTSIWGSVSNCDVLCRWRQACWGTMDAEWKGDWWQYECHCDTAGWRRLHHFNCTCDCTTCGVVHLHSQEPRWCDPTLCSAVSYWYLRVQILHVSYLSFLLFLHHCTLSQWCMSLCWFHICYSSPPIVHDTRLVWWEHPRLLFRGHGFESCLW